MKRFTFLFSLFLMLSIGTTAWADTNPDQLSKTQLTEVSEIVSGKKYLLNSNSNTAQNRHLGVDESGQVWNCETRETNMGMQWTFEKHASNKTYALKSADGKYIGTGMNSGNTLIMVQDTPSYFEVAAIFLPDGSAGFSLKNVDNSKYLRRNSSTEWLTDYTDEAPTGVNPAFWRIYSVDFDPATAVNVTSLDELSNEKTYVVQSARGFMIYAPTKATDRAWCSNNTAEGALDGIRNTISVNVTEANNQWALLKSTNSGKYYFYNVGKQQFLHADNPRTKFSDTPLSSTGEVLVSADGASGSYPWVLSVDGRHLNHSTDQLHSICTNWNDLNDAGNKVKIIEVGTFDPTAAMALIEEFEMDITTTDEYKTLRANVTVLENLISASIIGTEPGYFTEAITTAISTANTAISTANGVLGKDPLTKAELVEANNALLADIATYREAMAAALVPVTTGIYKLVSAYPGYMEQQSVEKAIYANSKTTTAWTTLDVDDPFFYWTITETDGKYTVQNMVTETYINGMATLGDAANVELVALGAGQFNIKCGGTYHTGGHDSGAGVSGWLTSWGGGNLNTADAWKLVKVEALPEAAQNALAEAKAEMAKAEALASDAYKNLASKIQSQMTKWTGIAKDVVGNGLITDAAWFSSNADHNALNATADGGGFAALIDGETTTFFHSAWQNGPAESHYLEVTMPETPVDFFIYMHKRMGTGNNMNRPADVTIYGSTDGATYTEIMDLPEMFEGTEGVPTTMTGTISAGSYKHFRFVVNNTSSPAQKNNGYPFFTFSEYQFYPAATTDAPTKAIIEALDAFYAIEKIEDIAAVDALVDGVELIINPPAENTFVPGGSPVATLEAGKQYFVYNASMTHENTQDRRGFIYNNGGTVALDKGFNQSYGSAPGERSIRTKDKNYLWTVTLNPGGTYQLTSVATGKYVNAAGAVDNSEYVQIHKAVEVGGMDGSVSSVKWLDNTSFTLDETENNAWVISGGTNNWCWNGNVDSWAGWQTAHAYVFYEAFEYTDTQLELYNDARVALGKTSVGYPVADAAERAPLAETVVLNPATENYEATLTEKLNAFKSSTNVQMPEDGKAYTFTSVVSSGVTRYFNYTEAGYELVDQTGDPLPETAILVCRKVADGQYAFVNTAGKYFMWRGSTAGNNSVKGYSDVYDAVNASSNTVLTVEKLVTGTNTGTSTQADLFGYMAVKGNRNEGSTPNYFVVKTAGGFDQADAMFYNAGFSSAILIEEVPYTVNVPSLNDASALGEDGVAAISTFSAPYPTVAPENVTVYYAKETVDASGETLAVMTAVEAGKAVPANTGVVLTSTAAGAITMLPATTETAGDFTDNLLVAADGTAVDAATNAYILTKKDETIAFYLLNETDRVVAEGKAYLVLHVHAPGEGTVKLNFRGNATGIENVETVETSVNAPIFDLSGRRVQNAVKGGIYIQNGKKFIVK